MTNPINALVDAAENSVSTLWQERIVSRIAESLDRELRDGLPMRMPDTERQAMAMLKGAAMELKVAAGALEQAAKVLKDHGKGYQASQAFQAAQRAHGQAHGLIGE